MTESQKLRLAGLFTVLVAIVTTVQTALTSPPFAEHFVFVATGILTYLAMAFTYAKQWLSPEVNNDGQKVTLWIFLAATVGGIADLLNVIHLSTNATMYVKLGISIVIMLINILSKQIFPSAFQKDKMNELKFK